MIRRLTNPIVLSQTTLHTTGLSRVAIVAVPHRSSTLYVTQRSFFGMLRPKTKNVKVEEVLFDKQSTHYSGTIFGFPADAVVFYAKTGAAIFAIFLIVGVFIKGYAMLSRFSLATVARLGFAGGFICSFVLYTVCIAMVRRFRINPNAVYNQSIALVMRNEAVVQHLGTHPRTGEFKAYCQSGGFRLPLIRRVRSGSYELSDLLGLKPKKLQMMFILRNPANGKEGFVTCDVRRETTGFMTSANTYKSLAVTLTDSARTSEAQTIVVIGRPEDVVYRGLMKL